MDAVKRLKDAMSADAGRQLSPELRGVVDHVDAQGRAWCSVPGNDELVVCATPVKVVGGDVVTVGIVADVLTATMNLTHPVTDDAVAEQALDEAQIAHDAASDAQSSAARAADAAVSAISDAAEAQEAAEQASDSAAEAREFADTAYANATAAGESAATARAEATAANSYALNALSWLGQVEDVLGTVSWIAEHGRWTPTTDTKADPRTQYWLPSGGSYEAVDVPEYTYAATEDASFEDGKDYYAYDAGNDAYVEHTPDYGYVPTEDESVQPGKEYYVLNETIGYEHRPTSDSTVQEGKDYYTRTGTGTDDDPYVYDIVDEPVDEDIATYYERVEVAQYSYSLVDDPVDEDIATYYEPVPTGDPSELGLFELVANNPASMGLYVLDTSGSISNYIATHLSLTDAGLWLLADGGGYSLLVASDGIKLLDRQGDPVALYGAGVQVGSLGGVHIEQRSRRFSFMQPGSTIALADAEIEEWTRLHPGEALPGEVAYISVEENAETHELSSTFYMNRSVVLDDLRFGNWKWYNRSNGHMTLQYVGADEVEA